MPARDEPLLLITDYSVGFSIGHTANSRFRSVVALKPSVGQRRPTQQCRPFLRRVPVPGLGAPMNGRSSTGTSRPTSTTPRLAQQVRCRSQLRVRHAVGRQYGHRSRATEWPLERRPERRRRFACPLYLGLTTSGGSRNTRHVPDTGLQIWRWTHGPGT